MINAPQATSRFGVRSSPTLVAVRDGKSVISQESVSAADLKPHIAYRNGEGPAPSLRAADRSSVGSRQATTRSPISISEAEFEREVLQADRPVAPTLEARAGQQAEPLKIVRVNVDGNPGVAGKYGVMSIPTMLVMKGGRELDRWVRALPEGALRSRVARWIQTERQTT